MDNSQATSIGIIMDGNRRFAKEKGMISFEGHRAGYKKLKECVLWCKEKNISTLYVYAFSTENWNRTPEEVDFLMKIFSELIEEGKKEYAENDVRVRFLGQRERFSPELRKGMEEIEELTKEKKSGTLVVLLSYGGRAEIVQAIKKIKDTSKVTEENFGNFLWSEGLPDPEMIIRTGGEKRLSNFLLWQGSYAELFFTETYWPALTKEEFSGMLDEYAKRKKNFGK